jgi:hypothetical protein
MNAVLALQSLATVADDHEAPLSTISNYCGS